MLSGFWSSAPDLTPPGWIDYFSVVGLFGVGVLVVFLCLHVFTAPAVGWWVWVRFWVGHK